MTRVLFLPLLAILALPGCSPGPLGSSFMGAAPAPVSAATQSACRQRVNEMYERRNRTDIYAANSAMNSPYSGGYQSGLSTRALSSQFDYEQTLRECERNSGTGQSQAPIVAPAAKR